ncbi:hypothetical protein PT277_06900 [Acetobacteraceae bacterium ESL0709]|nr:hypothetical protein [Acetobacteraceae bacterium ESL0697]MDF7678420.1 hypothetical protein [Acetobacteraceae bacterium ESL0709]
MPLQIIMTPECQVLHVGEDGNLHTSFIGRGLPKDRILCAYKQGGKYFLRTLGGAVKWYDVKKKAVSDLMPLDGVTVIAHAPNIYNILIDQKYLEVDWSGNPDFADHEGSQFRFLSEGDFDLLVRAVSGRWVCGPKGDVVTVDLRRSSVSDVLIGGIKVSFEQLLQALPEAFKTGELLLNEDWKVWRFVRYNPLLVIEAYGPDAPDELALVLDSLLENARYQDKIFILTDYNIAQLEKSGSLASFSGRVTFLDVTETRKRHDYLPRARLLREQSLLEGYGPVLFCSSGVVFGSEIETLLAKGALSRQVESLEYFYHPGFADKDQERDEALSLPSEGSGNIMLVPGMQAHQLYLEGAAALFEHCLTAYPQESLRPDGQMIINYALRRVRDFSSFLLSGRVLSGQYAQTLYGRDAEMVCFPITGEARSGQMKAYLSTVRDIRSGNIA